MSCSTGVCALLLLSTGRLASAAPLWEDVAHPSRRHCVALIEEAKQARAHDLAQNAAGLLRKAAALCPDDRDVLQALGETLLAARDFDEARQSLERAQALSSAATISHDAAIALAFHLGFAREVTGDLTGAIESHRALEAMGGLPAPNRYLVHYDLGDELMAVGRLAEAIDEYRTAVAQAPEKPVPRLALAVALDRDGQVSRSREELNIVLSLDPQLSLLSTGEYVFVPAGDEHYYRALGWLARGSTAQARAEMRAFLAQLPESPYAARASERLIELERQIDPRELDGAGIDAKPLAHALAPLVAALEDCLPAPQVVHIGLTWASAGVRTRPDHPAASCLDRVLSRAQVPSRRATTTMFTLPLAGRRAAPWPQ